jgi:MFS family permease
MEVNLTAGRALGFATIVALGWFIGGLVGLLAALLGLAAACWRGPRFVAAAAFVALLAAAILTAVEAPTGSKHRGVDFVTTRPLASEAGRIAAVLALVSIGIALASERAPEPEPEPE